MAREPHGWPTPYPLPGDTARLVRTQEGKVHNLGLWLDRYVSYERRGPGFDISQDAKRRATAPLGLERVRVLIQAHAARWQTMLRSVGAQPNRVVRQFVAAPEWRMVVGLGAAHVLETAITMHRLYGFPIIPGSALKGMTRAYAEIEGLAQAEVERLFGTTERAGRITFFDAVPLAPPHLELDVMNPHVSDYYEGSAPPADYLDPVPVYFLTVGPESPFGFAVAAGNEADAERTVNLLHDALDALGVGAKTVAGYGYLQRAEVPPIAPPSLEEVPRVAPLRERGRVKWFDPDRGYGFIAPAGGGKDVFVHISEVATDPIALQPGVEVEYDVEQTKRGLNARKVTLAG